MMFGITKLFEYHRRWFTSTILDIEYLGIFNVHKIVITILGVCRHTEIKSTEDATPACFLSTDIALPPYIWIIFLSLLLWKLFEECNLYNYSFYLIYIFPQCLDMTVLILFVPVRNALQVSSRPFEITSRIYRVGAPFSSSNFLGSFLDGFSCKS